MARKLWPYLVAGGALAAGAAVALSGDEVSSSSSTEDYGGKLLVFLSSGDGFEWLVFPQSARANVAVSLADGRATLGPTTRQLMEVAGEAAMFDDAQLAARLWVDEHPAMPRPTSDIDQSEPEPEQASVSVAMPSNVVELVTASDFNRWEVPIIVDPPAGFVPRERNLVVIGYADAWAGRPVTFERLAELARREPQIRWLLFSFAASKAAFGQPAGPMAFVTTAVGPTGELRESFASKNAQSGPFTVPGLVQLVEWAAAGVEPLREGAKLYQVDKAGVGVHTVLVQPRAGQPGFEWYVWRGSRGPFSSYMRRGEAATEPLALDAAEQYVLEYEVAVASAEAKPSGG